jgi:hypothetical protein
MDTDYQRRKFMYDSKQRINDGVFGEWWLLRWMEIMVVFISRVASLFRNPKN